MRTEVSQVEIWVEIEGGKSDPSSTIHEIVRDRGGGEKSLAPRAEKVPAPPAIPKTGGLGGR